MNKGVEKLKQGDKIGIFSPSAPITHTCPKRFERAKQYINAQGFEIIEGKLTGKHDFYRSGTIAEQAEELNELIRNSYLLRTCLGGFLWRMASLCGRNLSLFQGTADGFYRATAYFGKTCILDG